MRIQFNAREIELAEGTTVEALLGRFGLKKELVVVEIGTVIIDRADYAARVIAADEKVECISFMGGG